jgi:steroid delta-isomerase-like uncharacterized protein
MIKNTAVNITINNIIMITKTYAVTYKFIFVLAFCCYCCTLSFGQNPAANKEIAVKYFNEVVNGKKLNLISDIFSRDYVSHGMSGSSTQAIMDSSLVSFLNYFFKAVPDIHYTIDNIIAEGDMVAVNLTATGTQSGKFLGFPASQKRINFKEMYFFRISNNKITEGWGVTDIAGIKEQLSK